jgi:hypothetical protein
MGALEYKIIDNFLEKEDFYKFQGEIFNINNVPWYYRNSQTTDSINDMDDIGYFTLSFFNNWCNDFNGFNYFLYKIYEKLECRALIQSRANLCLKQKEIKKLYFHTDYTFKCKTAILYMNSNNGATILDENKQIKIDSIENRIIVFDSQIRHSVLAQSDTKRRIVLNINYF